MKVSVSMAVLSVSLLGLAGCASSGGTASSYTAPAATSNQQAQTRMDNDAEYMARVEAIARNRGIGVQWINPPRKIVAKQD